jgi:hypothetical protein
MILVCVVAMCRESKQNKTKSFLSF